MRRLLIAGLDEAGRRGSKAAAAEHLLLAVLHDEGCSAAQILARGGISPARLRDQLEARLDRNGRSAPRAQALTDGARRLIESADAESRKLHHAHVGTEHVLLALVNSGTGTAAEIIDRAGLTYGDALKGLSDWNKSGMPRTPVKVVGARPNGAVRRQVAALARKLLRWPALGYKVFVERSVGHPGFVSNPYPLYRWLRNHHPVRPDPLAGVWVVTRYEDVAAALRDPRFRRQPMASGELPEGVVRQLGGEAHGEAESQTLIGLLSPQMIFLDPPRHTRLRALFAKAFIPRIASMEGRVRWITDELLDATAANGGMDVIRDFAAPLPVTVIAELMGFPPEDREKLKRWSDYFAAVLRFSNDAAQLEKTRQSYEEIADYFEPIAQELRRRPRDNLLSALLNAEPASERLADGELFANAVLLLAAGHETTTNLIANGLHALLRHPDQLAQLIEEPSLIESAVEELLRFDCPVQWTARETTGEVELGGRKIPPDTTVLFSLGSANRDERQFPSPDRLDIARQENKHLAFGGGIHFCLGATLARMEAQIAIGAIAKRFPRLRLETKKLRWQKGLTFRAMNELRVRWD